MRDLRMMANPVVKVAVAMRVVAVKGGPAARRWWWRRRQGKMGVMPHVRGGGVGMGMVRREGVEGLGRGARLRIHVSALAAGKKGCAPVRQGEGAVRIAF